MDMDVKSGKYKHFKGFDVEVIGCGKHTETLEEFVIYRDHLCGDLWVRPKAMFTDIVERNGETKPRFRYLDN